MVTGQVESEKSSPRKKFSGLTGICREHLREPWLAPNTSAP